MDIQFRRSAVAVAILCSLGISPVETTLAAADPIMVQHHDDNTWLEINAANFENNLTILKNDVLQKDTQICAVMKSDAYGHGIANLIPSVIRLGIENVCIANNSEAQQAREKGYQGKLIRIRVAGLNEIEKGIQYDIEEMAGNLSLMQGISQLGGKHQKTIAIHFNINSAGMSRNGLDIDTQTGREEAAAILKLPNIRFAGIMTHFPDETEDAIRKGLIQFNADANWLIKLGKLDRSALKLHTANTFATTHVPESHLDMVRAGSMLYGMNAPQVTGLKPVMSMKTRVGSLQHYNKGDTVVYDRTFTLQRDSVLANLPVGYSDGYIRSFSNRTQVLINGQRFPVVGKITMNTVMVDVTGADIKPGDEVVLLGSQGRENISMKELMSASHSFYGEFFMNAGYANPRVVIR